MLTDKHSDLWVLAVAITNSLVSHFKDKNLTRFTAITVLELSVADHRSKVQRLVKEY